MENNFNGICYGKIAGISAVFLIFIIFGGIGAAANPDGSIAKEEDPCKSTGSPENCIPPSYRMNSRPDTTRNELLHPFFIWSDPIGEYYARAGISGDGNISLRDPIPEHSGCMTGQEKFSGQSPIPIPPCMRSRSQQMGNISPGYHRHNQPHRSSSSRTVRLEFPCSWYCLRNEKPSDFTIS